MNQIRYTSRPIAVEFFAGAGGLSLGLEQAGFDVVLAVDRDGYHVATHERNFPHGLAICASVTDLDGAKVRDLLGTDREIDLVAGGPPCQGFSHMGTRDVLDPRNTLVNEFVRLVLELRPKAFLMENVPGMQSGATAAIFQHALERWENEEPRYVITTPVRTLNAANFGVPQSRERLFVLGIRRDIARQARYPDGPSPGQPTRPNVEEAISDLPRLADHPEMLERDSTSYDESRACSHYARVLRGFELDPTDYSHPRRWDRSRVTCSAAVRHRPDIAALYAATRSGEMVPGHKLPKLRADGLAPTLRAGSESEHGSYTAPRPVHPYESRCITAREAARLHGYPDWFRFYPGKWHAYRQIGNSVCPPIGRALGRSIMSALGITPFRLEDALELSDEFHLPAERQPQHRRITQLLEWPKILNKLFENAIDKRGRLIKDFSVADVERAFVETSANMPRNPPRRFLADLSRSRNVQKLLKPLHDKGWTLAEVGENGKYGRFVPKGTAGAIDAKQTLSIGSREIPEAPTLRSKATSPFGAHELLGFLERRSVTQAMFGKARILIRGKRNLLDEIAADNVEFQVLSGNRCVSSGPVVIVQSRNLPTLPQVTMSMSKARSRGVIVLTPITGQHLAVFWIVLKNGIAFVRQQKVFRIVSEEAGAREGSVPHILQKGRGGRPRDSRPAGTSNLAVGFGHLIPGN